MAPSRGLTAVPTANESLENVTKVQLHENDSNEGIKLIPDSIQILAYFIFTYSP